MTRSYHYVYYPGGWYNTFLEKAHPNAIKEVIQTDKTYCFPKRSSRFKRRGKQQGLVELNMLRLKMLVRLF